MDSLVSSSEYRGISCDIDQKELKDWVEHSIRSVDEEEVDDRMKELDADSDGYVGFYDIIVIAILLGVVFFLKEPF